MITLEKLAHGKCPPGLNLENHADPVGVGGRRFIDGQSAGNREFMAFSTHGIEAFLEL